MPMLKNLKRERFCKEVLRNNGNATAAYTVAYGKVGHVAEAAGSRLLSQVEVRTRLNELSQPEERKVRVTAQSLLRELEQTIADARRAEQHGVVVNAAALSAKIAGVCERVEGGGHVGEFDHLDDIDSIARKMLEIRSLAEILADDDLLREALVRVAADQARPIN